MTRDLADAANRNMRAAYTGPAEFLDTGEARQFGSVTAAATGLPIPNFNRLAVLEVPEPDDLAAAIDWIADREASYQVTVTDEVLPAVADRLLDHGLAADDREPGMALPSLDDVAAPDHPAAAVSAVADETDLEAFVEVAADVFGFPIDVARDLMAPEVVGVEDLDFLLGRVDGEPVACGQLVVSGDVAGVYTIGVREGHRERGIGEAMSWAVLERGRQAGCAVGVLQASEMGRSIYERMGFEPVVTYHHFRPEAEET